MKYGLHWQRSTPVLVGASNQRDVECHPEGCLSTPVGLGESIAQYSRLGEG